MIPSSSSPASAMDVSSKQETGNPSLRHPPCSKRETGNPTWARTPNGRGIGSDSESTDVLPHTLPQTRRFLETKTNQKALAKKQKRLWRTRASPREARHLSTHPSPHRVTVMQSIGAISSRSQEVADLAACVRHPTVPDKHIPEHAATSIPHGHGHFSEPSMLGTFLGTTHLTSLPKNYEHHPFPLHLSVCLSVSGPSVARHGHLSVRPPPATGPSTAQAMTIPVQVPWNHPTDQTRPSDTWLVSRGCDQTKARNISHPVSPTPRPFRFPPPDTTPGQGQNESSNHRKKKGHQAEGQKSSLPSPGNEEKKEGNPKKCGNDRRGTSPRKHPGHQQFSPSTTTPRGFTP